MKKEPGKMEPSEFKQLKNIEYFNFEEDFVEENVRCIPMIVRFKMDAAGIKLKLHEWSLFSVAERIELAVKSCGTVEEAKAYHEWLSAIIQQHTGAEATILEISANPEWSVLDKVPTEVFARAVEHQVNLSAEQWRSLTNLQRFALLKLCRPGHESKNFIKALKEFHLATGAGN
jgi:hypothetical protein